MSILIDKLSAEIPNWKNVILSIEREDSGGSRSLRDGEREVFLELKDFWKYNDFNPNPAKDLINELKKHEPYHAPKWDELGEFRRICVQYYTKDKEAYESFQTNLGGRVSSQKPDYRKDSKNEYQSSETFPSEKGVSMFDIVNVFKHHKNEGGFYGYNISIGDEVFQEEKKFLSKIEDKSLFDDYNMFAMVTHEGFWGFRTGFAILTSKGNINFDWRDNLGNEELWNSLDPYIFIMDNDKYLLMALSEMTDTISGYWFKSVFLDPFRIVFYEFMTEDNSLIKFKINEKLQPFLYEILKLSDNFNAYNKTDYSDYL
jgi:hypothetical protein